MVRKYANVGPTVFITVVLTARDFMNHGAVQDISYVSTKVCTWLLRRPLTWEHNIALTLASQGEQLSVHFLWGDSE